MLSLHVHPATLFLIVGPLSAAIILYTHRSLFDPMWGQRSVRSIVLAAYGATALFAPLSMLVHEGGHAVAASLLGGRDVGVHLQLLSPKVTYSFLPGALSETDRAIIAVAGLAANIAAGAVSLLTGLYVPVGILGRYMLITASLSQMLFALVFYPVVDLLLRYEGDFHDALTLLPFGFWMVFLATGVAIAAFVLALVHTRVLRPLWRNTPATGLVSRSA